MGKPSRFWLNTPPEQRLRILKSSIRDAKARHEEALEEGDEWEISIARATLASAQRHLENEIRRQAEAQEEKKARRAARTRNRRERRKRNEKAGAASPAITSP